MSFYCDEKPNKIKFNFLFIFSEFYSFHCLYYRLWNIIHIGKINIHWTYTLVSWSIEFVCFFYQHFLLLALYIVNYMISMFRYYGTFFYDNYARSWLFTRGETERVLRILTWFHVQVLRQYSGLPGSLFSYSGQPNWLTWVFFNAF